MTPIDRSRPVMVTGATGYVASWLVKRLLDEGLTVHAPVRNPRAPEKVAHLDALANSTPGRIRYFHADLLEAGSYAEAMADCQLVFHTASPFTQHSEHPEQELLRPAVEGTKNVLEQANRTASVRRVVLTSSTAAIGADATDSRRGSLTEADWNTSASLEYQPYAFSKTVAERTAWDIAHAQDRWDLVVINPCLVMGPALNPVSGTSESLRLLRKMGSGELKFGVPRVGIGLVDVRDVAEAHYAAGFRPAAAGRYLTCGHCTDFVELTAALQPKYGDEYPIPSRSVPKWLLRLIGPLVDPALTRRFVRENVDVDWRADNGKVRRELGVSFRPLRETMEEAFGTLVEAGVMD
ncbi:NAD-dependent epimerase/dehydratase family protein [Lewinella sp. JB7]|uniref:NAD-dependent epimerase/dehydratase family protein n=1 Tax=Lewinella sp. JB7 TaxID=2962887 RepID=UPI0020C980E4|nr:NAD-dependent epimerase/dehydratase family protein [Lewinella sp. JB7]MCP9234388.1 NAD-dependent epimerase/dehydratase family protein [Lewinella sp. JB7]